MNVAYGSADTLPYVCAVYRCARCGRTAEQHGRHADELPSAWVAREREDELEHLCPQCAHGSPVPAGS